MKKQSSMTSFFTKKPRLEQSDTTELDPKPSDAPPPQAPLPPLEHGESSKSISSTESLPDLPACWTFQQYLNFKEKYEGLEVAHQKLGCKYCAKHDFAFEKGIHISKEWKHFKIEASGTSKEIQQASLRKKMKEHFTSKSHTICRDNFQQRDLDMITKSVDKSTNKHLSTTCKVFLTVYSLAQRCKPFSDIEGEVEFLTTVGVDLGVGLHSRRSAVKIVAFIANEIKTEMFSSIIGQNLKICLIIDEASTLSLKPVVIVFVKVEDSDNPATVFVELIELEKQDAETICSSVMGSLHKVGFTKEYLEKHLIAFCSDGASVMLGRKSGVSTRLAKEFPNIIIWHCLNHRLQLVLDDSIKDIKQLNHFKIFIDKIHTTFHKSCKSQTELFNISEQLGLEIVKIGRVLGPRWAACSLRSAIAVWRAYPALHQFFHGNQKYPGMAARLENINFLIDLALMIDILNEISLLSNALQGRNTDITKAEKFVLRSIKAFEMLRRGKGPYEKKVDGMITSEAFKNIKFVQNHRFVGLPREKLLESIITNLKKRLMDCEHLKTGSQLQDSNKLQFLTFLEPDYWNIEDVVVPWPEAEEQLLEFGEIFNYEINMNDYRDFVENVLKNPKNYAIPDSIKKAKDIVRTIAVSSAEAERGFSKMNLICSEQRTRLSIPNISNLMTISVIGLPAAQWDPIPSVRKWLRSQHRTADDPRIKSKKTEEGATANEKTLWKHLKAKDQ